MKLKAERLRVVSEIFKRQNPKIKVGNNPKKFIIDVIDSDPTIKNIWLLRYAYTGKLPQSSELENDQIQLSIFGTSKWVSNLLSQKISHKKIQFEIIQHSILVDVDHTAKSEFVTGIQRVTNNLVSQWMLDGKEITLIAWDKDRDYIRRATPTEISKFTESKISDSEIEIALLPLNCDYFLPELTADPDKTSRLKALFQATGSNFSAIGYDCVPITSPETTAPGMTYAFTGYLELLSKSRKILAISNSSAKEFEGWKKIISRGNLKLPKIISVPLPTEFFPKNTTNQSESKKTNVSLPLVSSIGSHEPRKNHLTLLRAVERLWKEGLQFKLVLIGGNSWSDLIFNLRVRWLQNRNYPVEILRETTDEEMVNIISNSLLTVFISLHEGFGLPVAESLFYGTPVVATNYGSIAEIADSGGAKLVDPRDLEDIISALRVLLTNNKELERLKKQVATLEHTTWKSYAETIWKEFSTVEG